MLDFLIVRLIGWVVVAPISTLWHELGHAIVALRFLDGPIRVELGAEPRPWVVPLGRLQLTLRLGSGFIGFCRWPSVPRSHRGAVLTMAGGPQATLLLFGLVIAAGQPELDEISFGRYLVTAFFWATLLGLIGTVIPMIDPRWWGGYAGHASDGLQVLRLLRRWRRP